MAIQDIIQYSTTAASNTTIDTTVNIAENCAAANINNAIRSLMANLANRFGSTFSLASATTTALGDQEEAYGVISGTTTITSFGTPGVANKFGFWVEFSGALTLTHNATSLILPGGANIITAAGDTGFFQHEGSGNWRCLSYMPATGIGVLGGTTASLGYELVAGGSGVSPAWAQRRGQNNFLDNARLMIDQARVGATSADGTLVRDRWYVLTQTSTVAASIGTGIVLRLTQSQASAQRFGIIQSISGNIPGNPRMLYDASITLSARIKCSSSQAIRYAVLQKSNTTIDVVNDWTSSTYTAGNFFTAAITSTPIIGSVTPSAATWTTFQATGTGPSSGVVSVMIWTEGTAAQNVTLDVEYVQLEIGTTASAFEFVPTALDLSRCERFYQKSFDYSTTPAQAVGAGTGEARWSQVVGASAAKKGDYVSFRTRMDLNATPTITLYNPVSANAQARNITQAVDCSATATANVTESGFSVEYTSGAGTSAGQAVGVHWTALVDY